MHVQQSEFKMHSESELQKIKIDLIVVGNSNTGKTSLIRRFVKGQQSFMHSIQPSIGMSLEKKDIILDNHHVTVQIWDTAGQEKFFAVSKNYFRKADGILVIFDLTDKNSFERINDFWIQQIKDSAPEGSSQIIIGNKIDLSNQRAVSYEYAESIAKGLGLKYYQTSAKSGDNIDEAINFIVRECISKVNVTEPTGISIGDSKKPEQTGCFLNTKGFFNKMFGDQKNKKNIQN